MDRMYQKIRMSVREENMQSCYTFAVCITHKAEGAVCLVPPYV